MSEIDLEVKRDKGVSMANPTLLVTWYLGTRLVFQFSIHFFILMFFFLLYSTENCTVYSTVLYEYCMIKSRVLYDKE